MPLQIKQSTERKSDRQWSWAVWLEPAEELADVESVTYNLHSTFSNPIQKRTNAEDQFRLEATGWGSFMILAEVELRGQKELLPIRHWLQLGDSEGDLNEASSGAPKVFVSSGSADADLAATVALGLDRFGYEAVTREDLPVGLDWDSPRFEQVFGKLAGAVVVVSGGSKTWVDEEVARFRHEAIPIFPIAVGEKTPLPKILENVQSFRVDSLSEENVEETVDRVGMSIKEFKG